MKLFVLIADDEPRHRREMVSLLESIDPDFRLLEARDGKSALETIVSTRVDVVITDICMPHMTGLELLKELKRIGSRVKMVILSVYGEFGFAKQALDVGVFGYLLKPIDVGEVKDMMSRLKEAIASEREASHSTAAIEQNLSRMVPIYDTYLLNRLLQSTKRDWDESMLIQKYPINQPGYLLLFEILYGDQPDADGLNEISENVRYWIGQAMAHRLPVVFPLEYRMRTIAVLLPGAEEPALTVLQGLQRKIRHEYGFGLSMSVSGRFENLFTYTRSAFQQAQIALQFSFYDQSQPHYFAELDCERPGTVVDRFQGEDHLSAALMSGEAEAARKAFDNVLGTVLGPPRPLPAALKRGIFNLVTGLIRKVGGALGSERLEDVTDMAALIENAATLDEARQLAHDILRTLAATITNRKADLQASAVEQGKRMIEREYAKPLGLEEVSRRFFYSPSYYSTLFKNTVGMSFSEYLANVRLTHAKRLLVSGDEPIGAVAARCGYNDCSYFARVFKRDVGCTPDEYRKIRGREDRGGGQP